MCTLCQARDPFSNNSDTHAGGSLESGSVSSDFTTSNVAAGKPVYTNDQIATYLTNGFWSANGQSQRSFDVQTGGTITYNIAGLDTLGKAAALKAFDAWSAVTGLTFKSATTAMIKLDDNAAGAYNSSVTAGDTIVSSTINISKTWRQYGDYYHQTFIHEIGHAMGLGHTGNYNGSASYGPDAEFANDSWQVSVMSYFDQVQNTSTNASRVWLATAQIADIVAIQNLYGTPTTIQTGDTTYGDGVTTTQFGMDLNASWAVTIVDNGGTDHVNLASRTNNQTLNLNAEAFSDINGKIGNFTIARGSVIENATTGSGNDVLIGNGANNTLSAGAGDDTIFGNDGDDVLIGGAGADLLTGGNGADIFAYENVSEALDTITDFSLNNGDRVDITNLLIALGYSGSDPVADGIVGLRKGTGGYWLTVDADGSGGAAAIDLVFIKGISSTVKVADIINLSGGGGGGGVGGDGSDSVYEFDMSFSKDWTVERGTIEDTDGGIDTIDISLVTAAARVYLDSSKIGRVAGKAFNIVAGSEIENLVLGTGSDTALGNLLDNMINGMLGSDKLYGLDGDDNLLGGEGNDRLYGGAGNDTLEGDAGKDAVYGEDGDDIITGGAGADKIYGGIGDDTLDGGDDKDSLYGLDGDDNILGGAGSDKIEGGLGNDTISGGDDGDGIKGGAGDDTIYGDAGNDTLEGGDGDDTVEGGEGNDKIKGGEGADEIAGDAGDDKLYGENGADIIFGGAGNDSVYGGNDDDTLDGGDGIDKIYGDKGADFLTGGAGNDSLYGGVDDDTLSGGDGDDLLYSHKGDDTINGGAGNDLIAADAGDDMIWGDEGDDTIKAGSEDDMVFGGEGNDAILGEAGNDVLFGDDGDDTIDGGTGDDVIYGGNGADYLKGGTGIDTFVFASLSELGDTIADFSLKSGDLIDVSGIMNELNTTTAAAISSGALSLVQLNRGSILQYDADGDGAGAAIDLVQLLKVSHETTLTSDWLT